MPLHPEPCFIETIRAESGSKRLLIQVTNANMNAMDYTISEVSKPDWVDVEKALLGDTLSFRAGGKLPLVVNVNTDHRRFPKEEKTLREEIEFTFDNDETLVIYLYLQEIIGGMDSYRGTFSMDFGTSNTCYAWKDRVGDNIQMSDLVKPPGVSEEVPTLIRFKDISMRENPTVEIGKIARHFIAHNSGNSFSYCISVKRLLGQDRQITILDERSGMEADRFQRYTSTEIASFIIRHLIKDAEKEIGQRIESVVATFPILYNRKKLDALSAAFKLAYEGMNREWSDERLVMQVDETNAASFNYISGQLLDEFRRFNVEESLYRLVSYDFGGGTVDVAVTDVDLKRDPTGRITITTTAKGLTGDAYFGGDNITLAVMNVLKLKLVKRIAEKKIEKIEAEKAEAAAVEEAKAVADDPWASVSNDGGGDPWGNLASEEAPTEETVAEEQPAAFDDSVEVDIYNMTNPAEIEAAVELVCAHGNVFDMAVLWGLGLSDALARMVAEGTKAGVATHEIKGLAQQLEKVVNVLLPTCWTTLEEQGDLIAKDTAKKLFHELWLPAEVAKIRAVSTEDRMGALSEPLYQIAKYSELSPADLMGVQVSEDEINAAIEKNLARSIGKAACLAKLVEEEGDMTSSSGGLDFGFTDGGSGAGASSRKTLVLLAGNSARLPIVRKLAVEAFGLSNDAVVMDPQGVKAAVAQGACEEHILRRDFGHEDGLIQYQSGDFLSRTPYTIGLFQKELSLIGYKGGFAPVIKRGAAVDSMVLLTDSLPVLHARSTELTFFAWYHDHGIGCDPEEANYVQGVEPRNIGWFDLVNPDGEWTQPLHEHVTAQLSGMEEGAIAKVLYIDADQHLVLIDPWTKEMFHMKEAPDLCRDQDNPFSGIH